MDRKVLELNGSLFEAMIAQQLKRLFPDGIPVLNKELYSYQLEKETQIDLLFITPKAIFVIEAKNWSEWVKGNYNDLHWTGRSKSKNIMRVISPYRQNFMHMRTLRNSAARAGVELPKLINIVCFPDGTLLDSDCKELCNFSELGPRVQQVLDEPGQLYDVNMLKVAIKKLG